MTKPLAGLTIVEMQGGVAVRYCGQLFARLGASVIQVGQPDETGVGYGGKGSSAYAAWLDGQKQHADNAAIVLANADLVIAGQSANDVADADRILWGNSKATRLGLTWFDTSGPYADWTGSDAVIQAMSGVAYATGPKDALPMLPRGHAPQVVAGATAFIAAMAALVGRKNGCDTRKIDVNVFEANLCFSESSVASAAITGATTVRRGINRFTPTFPGGIYQASDGWIGVTALTVPQWLAFCDLIGHPELGENPHHHIALQRMDDADALDPALIAALRTRPASYWLEEGQKRRIPLAPVPDLAELPTITHWCKRESFAAIDGVENGIGPSLPFRFETYPAQTSQEKKQVTAPLDGIRVLDLSMGWAGPLAARHFADLGADVVKVESCTHFDWWRGFDGSIDGDPPPYETRPNFLMVNRNKQGVTLDLKTDAGKKLVRQLAARSDILIENYAPGVLEKLELGARSLLAIKPNLICLSMGAFGAVGPWRSFRAYGSTVEQASGLPSINGDPNDPPTMQHVAYGDPVAGLYGAIAALAMMYHRLESGAGAIIDLGQVECLFQLGADAIVAQSMQHDLLVRDGSRHPSSALRAVFATATSDQWIAVSVERPEQWNALAQVIGSADLLSKAGSIDALKPYEREMEAGFAAFAAHQDASDVVSLLQGHGIAAGPVHSALTLTCDPQLVANNFWRRADRTFVGSHVVPHAPYSLDGERCGLRGVSPTLGQHNEAVLGGKLGLSQTELAELTASGVIGTHAVA